jgi:hypothetical protein
MAWYVTVKFRIHQRLLNLTQPLFLRQNRKLSDDKPTLEWVTATEDQLTAHIATPPRERGPQGIAIFAAIAIFGWLAFMALTTVDYFGMIFKMGINSMWGLLLGQDTGRQLFVAQNGQMAPIWETVFALGSVMISLVALMWGMQRMWRRAHFNALVFLFALSGLSYFAFLGLRFTPASWELSHRSAAYLFIGLAYVVAVAVVELWNQQRWLQTQGALLFAGALYVLFAGGVIAGWQPQLRLTQPYVVAAGDQVINAEGYSVANWMRTELGAGKRMAADTVNGLQILAYGEQRPSIGRFSFVKILLNDAPLMHWHIDVMAEWNLEYMVVDRRLSAWNNMLGYFFTRKDAVDPATDWQTPEVIEKFDRLHSVSRVMDSGNIVVYEVGDIRYE